MMTSKNTDIDYQREKEISLSELFALIKKYFNHLLRNWLLIVVVGTTGAIGGLVYSIIYKPTFTAVTTFVLEESGSGKAGLGGLGGIASMVGIDLNSGGGLFTGDNIIELYKSRTMIQKTLLSEANFNGKNQLIIDRYVEFNELKKKWDFVNWENIDFKNNTKVNLTRDSILGEVVKLINKVNLNVSKPDKKLSIIKVQFNSKDQLFAKVFSDQIVSAVNEFYIKTKTQRSKQNVAILQAKTDSVRGQMTGSIQTASYITDATPNLNPTRQSQRTIPVQRSQFSIETNKLVLSELIKNLELAKITELKETPLIQVIDRPIYPLERDRFGKIKGILIGGILFGFLTVAWLISRLIIKNP